MVQVKWHSGNCLWLGMKAGVKAGGTETCERERDGRGGLRMAGTVRAVPRAVIVRERKDGYVEWVTVETFLGEEIGADDAIVT